MEIGIGFIGAGFVSLMHRPAIEYVKNARFVGFNDSGESVRIQRSKEWGVTAFQSIT